MPRLNECIRCQKRSAEVVCRRYRVAKYCSKGCQERDQWRHKAACDAAAVLKVCQCCGESSENLKTCSGCFQTFYCDVECQRKDRLKVVIIQVHWVCWFLVLETYETFAWRAHRFPRIVKLKSWSLHWTTTSRAPWRDWFYFFTCSSQVKYCSIVAPQYFYYFLLLDP